MKQTILKEAKYWLAVLVATFLTCSYATIELRELEHNAKSVRAEHNSESKNNLAKYNWVVGSEDYLEHATEQHGLLLAIN